METAIFLILLGLVILFAVLFVISFFKQRRNLKWVAPLLVVMLVIFVFQGNISELTIKAPGVEMSLKAFQQQADSALAGVPLMLPPGEPPDIPAAALQFAANIEGDSVAQRYLAEDLTTLIKLGNVQYAAGKVDAALASYDRASAIAAQKGDKTTQVAALDNMTTVYHDKGEADKALEYQHKVLEINRISGDREGEVTSLSRIGLIQNEKGDSVAALRYIGEAEAVVDSHDLERSRETVMRALNEIRRGRTRR